MPIVLEQKEVLAQSEAVFKQFGELWKKNCEFNSKLEYKKANTLRNSGVGKFAVMAAMGSSLEDNLETIKKYRDRFDLVCNDKLFGLLADRGVIADSVILCDANIPYSNIEPYIEKTGNTKLIATCYANTEWTKNWKGERYFFINKDSINSERIFLPIMGHTTRTIPAGSNVSNAMVTFFTGSDQFQNINFGGYEKMFLVGYDYSWLNKGNYYAWKNPVPKRHYMNHRSMLDINGDIVHTSENLLFSAKWLYSYISTFRLPVVNCSGRGLLQTNQSNLEKELSKINPDKAKRDNVIELFKKANDAYSLSLIASREFEKAREALTCQ